MSNTCRRHLDLASSSMHGRARLLPLLVILLLPVSACNFGAPSRGKATPPPNTSPTVPTYDFPAVDANYVYDQLYYLSSTFQQRESGFDRSPEQNGHQAFARYWAQEMQQNLRGFAPTVTYAPFQGGWISRAADSPSYNVEVTVPGALHPEQVVVVGSHYDGMHVSQGSAFDDTSGCAILLGEARALGDYWRARHRGGRALLSPVPRGADAAHRAALAPARRDGDNAECCMMGERSRLPGRIDLLSGVGLRIARKQRTVVVS